MTREEEIKLVASCHIAASNDDFKEYYEGFIAGAEWADKTNANGKELLYVAQKTAERTKEEVISKACDWLEDELYEVMAEPNPYYISDVQSKSYTSLEVLINDFKKAMEGQL